MAKSHFYSHYQTIEYKTAALYVRCSREEQARNGDTIEAQTEDLKAFAKEHHLKVYDIYTDEGYTARKRYNKRREFVRMLEDCRNNKFEYIIFTKLDRWFRNVGDFYEIQKILDKAGVVWLTALERYEMETTNGRLNVNIRLAVAQDESDRDSDRIKDVFRLKIKKGEIINGNDIFGYMIQDKKYVINPETAPIVKEIFDLYELTNSQYQVLRHINSKYGVEHTPLFIRTALTRRAYLGEYRDNPSYFPPLIDKVQFDRVQEIVDKKNVKRPRVNRVYIFGGLMICGCCGRRMGGVAATYKTGKKWQGYRCLRKSSGLCDISGAIGERTIEEYLLLNVKPLLDQYIAEYEVKQKKSRPAVNVAAIKNKLNKLQDLYINDLVDMDYYRANYTALQEELKKAEKVKETTHDLKPLREFLSYDLQTIYDSLTNEEKRQLWGSIIDRIEVDKAKNIRVYFL